MIKSTTRSIWTGGEQDNDANVFSFPHGGSPCYESDLESQQILQLRLLFFLSAHHCPVVLVLSIDGTNLELSLCHSLQ